MCAQNVDLSGRRDSTDRLAEPVAVAPLRGHRHVPASASNRLLEQRHRVQPRSCNFRRWASASGIDANRTRAVCGELTGA